MFGKVMTRNPMNFIISQFMYICVSELFLWVFIKHSFFNLHFAPLYCTFCNLNLVFFFPFKLNNMLIQKMSLMCCLKSTEPLASGVDYTGEFELDDMISSQVQIFIQQLCTS
jgi:hypothetical protein